MDLERKAIRIASASSIVVGIIVTMIVWGRLGFDLNQIVPVSTLIVLCFLITAAQALGPTPNCELEILCGPRQVAVPAISTALIWLAYKCGVDYSAFGSSFGLNDPNEGYLALGIAAGYFAAEVYIGASVWVNGGRGSGW